MSDKIAALFTLKNAISHSLDAKAFSEAAQFHNDLEKLIKQTNFEHLSELEQQSFIELYESYNLWFERLNLLQTETKHELHSFIKNNKKLQKYNL
ncbi:hypothetical protein [Pseudoalteromonas sp.]|uniref:hypothetical protein n=1 Tax=Pseudoalteromonas sp. TaxID=53249 RepID=UPI003565EF33